MSASPGVASMPRRADTTKGPPLRILSLDGGGVRGYSMFILLQELMHRTYVEIYGTAPKKHEVPKPCDHFDLIVGTGTGGLIAIMLGRLRMDLDTCKDVYVRMTKKVFETDKTIAGIPYRATLFKASKLEEAIRDCVREHTVFDDEGNDRLATAQDIYSPMSPNGPASMYSGRGGSSSANNGMQRSLSSASGVSCASGLQPDSMSFRRSFGGPGRYGGNPDALLYDVREERTKTAVTAVLRGTARHAPATFLRSYDSRKEPAPEGECAIWQAGRATCAIGLAFKPIQIRQAVFIDEGNGRFNPSPQALDEAVQNEWPGREIGVFVSVGTGKRPRDTDHLQAKWYESFLGGSLGDFAEARRRLMAKIEGSEETHRYMLREHLAQRGVPVDNYFRLNVEVGVGEFGMNEWSRLSDVAINTRHYLNRPEVQAMNHNASVRMARIFRSKVRWERSLRFGEGAGSAGDRLSWEYGQEPGDYLEQQQSHSQSQSQPYTQQQQVPYVPPAPPSTFELPADEGYSGSRPASQHVQSHAYTQSASSEDKFAVLPSDSQPLPGRPQGGRTAVSPPPSQGPFGPPIRTRTDDLPEAYIPGPPPSSHPTQRLSEDLPEHVEPPPLPPKTPIGTRPVPGPPPPVPPRQASGGPAQRQQSPNSFHMGAMQHNLPPPPPGPPPSGAGGHYGLPYPDMDGPPPAVNMARKPDFPR